MAFIVSLPYLTLKQVKWSNLNRQKDRQFMISWKLFQHSKPLGPFLILKKGLQLKSNPIKWFAVHYFVCLGCFNILNLWDQFKGDTQVISCKLIVYDLEAWVKGETNKDTYGQGSGYQHFFHVPLHNFNDSIVSFMSYKQNYTITWLTWLRVGELCTLWMTLNKEI